MTVTPGGEPHLEPLDGADRAVAEPSAADLAASAAPPGLATLHVVLDRVATRLGLRSVTIVVDDPDLGRQAFRAGPGPFGPGALTGEPGCRADPPLPPDRLDGELLVALCAASLRVDLLREDAAPGIDATEVALRRLPGVVAVVVERDDGVLIVQIHAGDDAPDDLARAAARASAGLAEGAVVVEIIRAAAAEPRPATTSATVGAPRGGPELVAVRSAPETGEIEAHVRRGEVRTIGRAPMAHGLTGAADAVLNALRQHDARLDLRVGWARTIETTADRRFVVAVALQHAGTRVTRHGLGTGSSAIEGAARAAYDAAIRPDEGATQV